MIKKYGMHLKRLLVLVLTSKTVKYFINTTEGKSLKSEYLNLLFLKKNFFFIGKSIFRCIVPFA